MNTQLSLGDEVRQEVARIMKRFDGLDIGSIRMSVAPKIVQHIDELEAHKASWTCGHAKRGETNTRRNNGILDFNANLERVKKANACEEMLFETEGALTNAGIREGVGL